MKKHFLFFCLFFIGIAVCTQPVSAGNKSQQNDTLRILAIGNSFSVDGLTYLQEIAEAAGRPIVIGNLYIGGCSLERHLQNSMTDDKPYRYYKNECGVKSEADFSLADGIKDEYWDVISFQQASHYSGMYDTYTPYLSSLQGYVREQALNKDARFVWHMTWAYASDSDHSGFANYQNSQQAMYKAIKEVAEKAKKEYRFSYIIPSGETIQRCRKTSIGDHLTRDGYHLNDLGRFAAGCTWYIMLFGESVKDNTYQPETITSKDAKIARRIAEKSCRRFK
ncbi:MAG: DUF4886 domain-containing protein [Bacteroidales bacterium]